MNVFYNYIYVDPRKPGRFKYENFSLLFEPFYVGKGKGSRFSGHLKTPRKNSTNPFKDRKFLKLKHTYNMKNFVVLINKHKSEEDAFSSEVSLIKEIGRLDQKKGPLLNLNDGGFGGNQNLGKTFSKEVNMKKGDFCRGKTYEELYGKEKADELKSQRAEVFRAIDKNGKKNPFFGKSHSTKTKKILSEKAKKQMVDNHPNANTYFLTSPMGECFEISGGLKKFCEENHLSYSTMKKFVCKGPISFENYPSNLRSRFSKNEKSKNCLGWSIKL